MSPCNLEISTANREVASRDWYDQVWIGFNDIEQVTIFKWTDGTQVDFLNWSVDFPGCCVSNRCVFYGADLENGDPAGFKTWRSLPCESTLRAFVCKKSANF